MTRQYIRSLSRLNLLMPSQITHEGFEMVWGTSLSIYHAPPSHTEFTRLSGYNTVLGLLSHPWQVVCTR